MFLLLPPLDHKEYFNDFWTFEKEECKGDRSAALEHSFSQCSSSWHILKPNKQHNTFAGSWQSCEITVLGHMEMWYYLEKQKMKPSNFSPCTHRMTVVQLLSHVWLFVTPESRLQCSRLPCPSLSPVVFPDPCLFSRWFYSTISYSVTPFSCLWSFPASGSFPVSWLFTSGDQSMRSSASASVFPTNIQGWFLLGLTGLVSLLFKGLLRVFFSTTIRKHQFLGAQPSLWSYSHICTWVLEKTTALTIQTFVSKVMSLFFNTLSRFVTAFLLRSVF